MALDFTTGILDARVTVTRALNTATRTNSSGVIEIVNANLPRFDYNPVTLAARGLLIEESRTNLFLNSLINGTALSTQTVVVTAVAHTISFYGTGTITLTGAATATVTGTGAYPNRQTLTFTPIVGGLICTVTGSVEYAQLEVGGFVTSFIPTAATSVTRNADAVSMTGTNFSDWYNATESSVVIQYGGQSSFGRAFTFSDGTASNQIWIEPAYTVRASAATQYTTSIPGITYPAKVGLVFKQNRFAAVANGGIVVSGASGNIPVVDRLFLGSNATGAGSFVNNTIAKFMYYPQALLNAEARAFSK
jgi:hypothetical protein